MYRKKLIDDIDRLERRVLEIGVYHHIEDDLNIGRIVAILADMRREARIDKAIEDEMNGRKKR